MTTAMIAWPPLLECSVCGWLAYEGDEDRYCEQHEDAMQPVGP